MALSRTGGVEMDMLQDTESRVSPGPLLESNKFPIVFLFSSCLFPLTVICRKNNRRLEGPQEGDVEFTKKRYTNSMCLAAVDSWTAS